MFIQPEGEVGRMEGKQKRKDTYSSLATLQQLKVTACWQTSHFPGL